MTRQPHELGKSNQFSELQEFLLVSPQTEPRLCQPWIPQARQTQPWNPLISAGCKRLNKYGKSKSLAQLVSRWPASRQRAVVVLVALIVAVASWCRTVAAQDAGDVPPIEAPAGLVDVVTGGVPALTSPEGLSSALQIMLLLTVLSMAPAVLLMTTSFIRIIVVLGLLRQALGVQQLPPSQVITSITLFLTVLIMTPVWTEVYQDSIAPYTDSSIEMSLDEAWRAGVRPIRRFMSRQIANAKNEEDILLFYEYLPKDTPPPENYEDVPLQVLLPAFMLSELKTAFMIGFQIYLPFLILDIVIASVTISMGMLMLPPVMISLPFKLMLFVLVDGWRLVVGMLLESFGPL